MRLRAAANLPPWWLSTVASRLVDLANVRAIADGFARGKD